MFGIRRIYPKGPVTDPSFAGAALLVCGHGGISPSSPLPERRRVMAQACGFAEAAGCNLYGPPTLETVFAGLRARPMFLVPHFMSAGTTLAALHARLAEMPAGRDVVVCPPFGAHAGLPRRIAEAAREGAVCRGWPLARTALLLIGHGSRINGASGGFLRGLRQDLRQWSAFGEVKAAFLSEEPGIDAALSEIASPQIVAVGCFAASGRHAARDVPALLARTERPLAYTGAVGEAPWADQLLLEQAMHGARDRGLEGESPLRRAGGT